MPTNSSNTYRTGASVSVTPVSYNNTLENRVSLFALIPKSQDSANNFLISKVGKSVYRYYDRWLFSNVEYRTTNTAHSAILSANLYGLNSSNVISSVFRSSNVLLFAPRGWGNNLEIRTTNTAFSTFTNSVVYYIRNSYLEANNYLAPFPVQSYYIAPVLNPAEVRANNQGFSTTLSANLYGLNSTNTISTVLRSSNVASYYIAPVLNPAEVRQGNSGFSTITDSVIYYIRNSYLESNNYLSPFPTQSYYIAPVLNPAEVRQGNSGFSTIVYSLRQNPSGNTYLKSSNVQAFYNLGFYTDDAKAPNNAFVDFNKFNKYPSSNGYNEIVNVYSYYIAPVLNPAEVRQGNSGFSTIVYTLRQNPSSNTYLKSSNVESYYIAPVLNPAEVRQGNSGFSTIVYTLRQNPSSNTYLKSSNVASYYIAPVLNSAEIRQGNTGFSTIVYTLRQNPSSNTYLKSTNVATYYNLGFYTDDAKAPNNAFVDFNKFNKIASANVATFNTQPYYILGYTQSNTNNVETSYTDLNIIKVANTYNKDGNILISIPYAFSNTTLSADSNTSYLTDIPLKSANTKTMTGNNVFVPFINTYIATPLDDNIEVTAAYEPYLYNIQIAREFDITLGVKEPVLPPVVPGFTGVFLVIPTRAVTGGEELTLRQSPLQIWNT